MENYLLGQECTFAFNIWDMNSARAVMDGASSAGRGVILQTSPGIYAKMDTESLRQFVSSYARKNHINVWLHLDHCRNFAMIRDAITCGWDSVMIDASDKAVEDNILLTKQVITEAHNHGVLVEAEVGQIQGIEDEIQASDMGIAREEDIRKFLQHVNVDMVAVAFGNAHGIYHGSPDLHYELIDYVASISHIPFVVHGGSGLDSMVLKSLIHRSNVKKINISTEVKLAYRDGIMRSIEQGLLEKEGFQANSVEGKIYDSIYAMTMQKLELLNKEQ